MKPFSRILLATMTMALLASISVFFLAKYKRKHQELPAKPLPASETEQSAQEPIPAVPGSDPFFYKDVGTSNPTTKGDSKQERVTRYTVQVASVTSRKDAEELLMTLAEQGIHGFYTPVRQGTVVIYHVRVGIFSDQIAAKETLATFEHKTNQKGSITELH